MVTTVNNIVQRKVGKNYSAFIIADIFANCSHNFNRAVTLIKKVKIEALDVMIASLENFLTQDHQKGLN